MPNLYICKCLSLYLCVLIDVQRYYFCLIKFLQKVCLYRLESYIHLSFTFAYFMNLYLYLQSYRYVIYVYTVLQAYILCLSYLSYIYLYCYYCLFCQSTFLSNKPIYIQLLHSMRGLLHLNNNSKAFTQIFLLRLKGLLYCDCRGLLRSKGAIAIVGGIKKAAALTPPLNQLV